MVDNLLLPQNRIKHATLDRLLKNSRLGYCASAYLTAAEQEGKSPQTLMAYAYALNAFLRYCSDHVPEPSEMRVYLLSLLNRGLSPATVHQHYRSLKTFFYWAIGERLIDEKSDPMFHVKGPSIPKKIIQPFTLEEIRRILVCCSGRNPTAIRNRAIVLTFMDTGLRLFELAEMQRVGNLEDGIRIMGKGQKERIVRIGSVARTAITYYLAKRSDTLPDLWLTEHGKPMAKQGIQIMVSRLSLQAGIKGKKHGPHTWRHTFASLCKANGMDIYVLQKLLGHSDIKTTENYLQSLGYEMLESEHMKFSPVDNFKLPL